ncbi:hypothetical protein [Streptomyces sp. NPDC002054]|uniref:hypothetical protein n=1 Tax=Streptomyces sp. NPDC002054 TaxID=3154663 RepID=UPI003317172E
MSGDTNNNYGTVVNMHGGTNNTGIVNHHGTGGPGASPAPDPALEQAVRTLLERLDELQAQVGPADAQYIDEARPAITADPAVQPEARNRALLTVLGIATTVGALGQPVQAAVEALRGLLAG